MVGRQTLESWKMPSVAGMWRCELFHVLLVAVQNSQPFWRAVWHYIYKLSMDTCIVWDPANQLLGGYTKQMII